MVYCRNKKLILLVTFLSVTLLAGIALANTEWVYGYLNPDGSLVMFTKVRTHTYTGSIYMDLRNMTSGYTRLGLRDPNTNVQFTDTEQWDWVPQTKNFNWAGQPNNQSFPYGKKFAINGRMASGYLFPDTYFAGYLTY